MQTNSASDLAVIVTRMRTVKQFGISSKTRLTQLCFKKDMFQKVKDVNFDFDEFVHFYANENSTKSRLTYWPIHILKFIDPQPKISYEITFQVIVEYHSGHNSPRNGLSTSSESTSLCLTTWSFYIWHILKFHDPAKKFIWNKLAGGREYRSGHNSTRGGLSMSSESTSSCLTWPFGTKMSRHGFVGSHQRICKGCQGKLLSQNGSSTFIEVSPTQWNVSLKKYIRKHTGRSYMIQ